MKSIFDYRHNTGKFINYCVNRHWLKNHYPEHDEALNFFDKRTFNMPNLRVRCFNMMSCRNNKWHIGFYIKSHDPDEISSMVNTILEAGIGESIQKQLDKNFNTLKVNSRVHQLIDSGSVMFDFEITLYLEKIFDIGAINQLMVYFKLKENADGS